MKSTLTLEDTPKGLLATVRLVDNDITDNPAQSLSTLVMTQLLEVIKQHARVGAIRLEKE